MSTLDEQLYIDAVIVKGIGRTLSVSVTVDSDNGNVPLDLTDYSIIFDVLGSAEGDGQVLIHKVITTDTDENTVGKINEAPETGEFTFTISAEDTNLLGLGNHPICIKIVDADTMDVVYVLTEGGVAQGEFSKIQIVRV